MSRDAPKAILFDADGVIQHPGVDYHSVLVALLGPNRDDAERFIAEIFATEKPALCGARNFVEDLTQVLAGWHLAERLEEVLGVWTAIEIDRAMCSAIASLHALGIQCCLATNQQAYRGRYMSETLRYCEVFHREFYSYRLGFAKPDTQYFRAIVEDLGLAPQQVLFIDDHEGNVLAAREVGLHASLFVGGPAESSKALRVILEKHGIHLP